MFQQSSGTGSPLLSGTPANLQNVNSNAEFRWSTRYLDKNVATTWLLKGNAHVDTSSASAKWLHLKGQGSGWTQPRAGLPYCFVISDHSHENAELIMFRHELNYSLTCSAWCATLPRAHQVQAKKHIFQNTSKNKQCVQRGNYFSDMSSVRK